MGKYKMPLAKSPGTCSRCKQKSEQLYSYGGGVFCKGCSSSIIRKRKLQNKEQRAKEKATK